MITFFDFEMTIPKKTAVMLCKKFNQDRDKLNYNDIDKIIVINEECHCTFKVFSSNEEIKEAYLFKENSDFFEWMGDNTYDYLIGGNIDKYLGFKIDDIETIFDENYKFKINLKDFEINTDMGPIYLNNIETYWTHS